MQSSCKLLLKEKLFLSTQTLLADIFELIYNEMIFENKKEIDEILYNKCSCVCEEMKTKIKERK